MGLKERLSGKRVYFDTNIVIYLVEGLIEYQIVVRRMGKASVCQNDFKVQLFHGGFYKPQLLDKDTQSEACPSLMGISRPAGDVPDTKHRMLGTGRPLMRFAPLRGVILIRSTTLTASYLLNDCEAVTSELMLCESLIQPLKIESTEGKDNAGIPSTVYS